MYSQRGDTGPAYPVGPHVGRPGAGVASRKACSDDAAVKVRRVWDEGVARTEVLLGQVK